MEINFDLDSFNKIYNVGEIITGNVVISNSEKTFDFENISITLTVKNYPKLYFFMKIKF